MARYTLKLEVPSSTMGKPTPRQPKILSFSAPVILTDGPLSLSTSCSSSRSRLAASSTMTSLSSSLSPKDLSEMARYLSLGREMHSRRQPKLVSRLIASIPGLFFQIKDYQSGLYDETYIVKRTQFAKAGKRKKHTSHQRDSKLLQAIDMLAPSFN